MDKDTRVRKERSLTIKPTKLALTCGATSEKIYTMPENLISDASRKSLVTRKKHVTVLASVIRANQ
jgi:hypothetical protein